VALGADALARPDARRLLLVGAGAQGRAQLEALRLVRPIEEILVLDPDPGALGRLRMTPAAAGLAVRGVGSLEDGIDGADVVVTATWAREPFLFRRHLRPGLHVTTLGPDQPGKCEVAADALGAARVVVDDRRLAVEMGAVGGAGLGEEAIWADLGEVLAGLMPGREAQGDVTVFGAVGLPFQDLAAAWQAYGTARARGLGRWIDFLA
jgi:ornithine cyclodeaminase